MLLRRFEVERRALDLRPAFHVDSDSIRVASTSRRFAAFETTHSRTPNLDPTVTLVTPSFFFVSVIARVVTSDFSNDVRGSATRATDSTSCR